MSGLVSIKGERRWMNIKKNGFKGGSRGVRYNQGNHASSSSSSSSIPSASNGSPSSSSSSSGDSTGFP